MLKIATTLHSRAKLSRAVALVLVTLFAHSLVVGPSLAQKIERNIKTEARFLSFDTEAKTMQVLVKKTGNEPRNKVLALKDGEKATFNVHPLGSVLKRTNITINGKHAAFTDIPENKLVHIYWLEDEEESNKRFARKVDLVLSEGEIETHGKARLEAGEQPSSLAPLRSPFLLNSHGMMEWRN